MTATAATLPALRVDLAAVRNFWCALVRPGDVHEVRAPKSRGRWRGVVSGYFDNAEALCAELRGTSGADAEGIYLTLNPANPALLARAANRVKMNARETTANGDILRRTTILFDIDAVRPPGISSTDAERNAALALRDTIRDFLREEVGWPDPLAVSMSGNGGALLYRVDLPNDPEATALVEGVLKALAALFNSKAATVDTATANAARVTKILGTTAAKGDNLPDRPWRLATGTVNPEAPVVPREALARLAALAPEVERPMARPGGNGASGPRYDVRELLSRAGIGWNEKAKAAYTVLALERCLTSPDHADGAALLEFASGAVAYKCLHARCAGKGWPDVRPILAPEAGAGRTKKSKNKRGEEKPKAPPELAGRRIHPALHFDPDGFAAVGILDGGTWRTVTSDRLEYPTEALADILTPEPSTYPALGERWPASARAAFVKGEAPAASWATAATLALKIFRDYIELDADPPYAVLATWTLGSYCYSALPSFPRLNLHGEKGSGKSKALKLIATLAHNGLWRTAPTPATLFRLIETLRPTLCLDELEHMDRDDRGDIAAILNAGYQAGGAVDRCDPVTFNVRPFAVYAPVAVAGIKGINSVLADRSITIIMQPGRDPARVNRPVDLTAPDSRFAIFRDLAYRLALTRWRELRTIWERLEMPAWLNGRSRELWSPLLALAELVVSEAPGVDLRPALLALARPDAEDRAELPELSAAVLTALEDKLCEADSLTVQPGELKDRVHDITGYDVSPNAIGLRLKALGFVRDRGRKGGSWYPVTRDRIQAIRDRRTLIEHDPTGGTQNLIP
ncbi:MAG: hypothetical protein HY712_04360 [candidate division NC10 bacterium]|nr:hypothetical protein [candidate division NC10 bacterium]